MDDSSRLLNQISQVGNQMNTLQQFRGYEQSSVDMYNTGLRHTEDIVRSITNLTGGGMLMKAGTTVAQKAAPAFEDAVQSAKDAAGDAISDAMQATTNVAKKAVASVMNDSTGASGAATPAAQQSILDADPEAGVSGLEATDPAAAGAAEGATAGAVTEASVDGALGSATAASASADWNPIGLGVTAALGLATVLAGVFGHKQEESVPRHSPNQPLVANLSTQFGV